MRSFSSPPAARLPPRDDPLVKFALLQGLPHTARRSPLGSEPLPWGSLPLRRHQHRESTCHGLASPAAFRPRGFAPPRRFTPPSALRACFIPLAPMGFRPSGVSPPKELHRLFGGAVPSWRFLPAYLSSAERQLRALPSCASRIRSEAFSRLQGLAPPGSPFTTTSRLSTPWAVPLVDFSLPRVFP